MAQTTLSGSAGPRTLAFLRSAAERGDSLEVRTSGDVVSDSLALGRRLMILAMAAGMAAVSSSPNVNEPPELTSLEVSVNGARVEPDPFLSKLIQTSSTPDDTDEGGPIDHELLAGLTRCSPGLERIAPQLLLIAYRYTAQWQPRVTHGHTEAIRALAQAYAEVLTWSADSGRSQELGIAAYCHNTSDWRQQIEQWDMYAAQQEDPRAFYRSLVSQHRVNIYRNVAQAHWEYQEHHRIFDALPGAGLAVKVRGDYRGWVSAIGSVARGVAEVAGDRRSQDFVRGATGVAYSGAATARGLERVGEAASIYGRVDMAGRSISDLARLGRNADRLLGAEKGSAEARRSQPRKSQSAAAHPRGAVSKDAHAIASLSEAAQRMGYRVSLIPLTGEPIPRDHPTVLATQSADIQIARQEAQRNLAEVAALYEIARATGMQVDFDPMFQQYAALADDVRTREVESARISYPSAVQRGG